jgi:hypothetical protein
MSELQLYYQVTNTQREGTTQLFDVREIRLAHATSKPMADVLEETRAGNYWSERGDGDGSNAKMLPTIEWLDSHPNVLSMLSTYDDFVVSWMNTDSGWCSPEFTFPREYTEVVRSMALLKKIGGRVETARRKIEKAKGRNAGKRSVSNWSFRDPELFVGALVAMKTPTYERIQVPDDVAGNRWGRIWEVA